MVKNFTKKGLKKDFCFYFCSTETTEMFLFLFYRYQIFLLNFNNLTILKGDQ